MNFAEMLRLQSLWFDVVTRSPQSREHKGTWWRFRSLGSSVCAFMGCHCLACQHSWVHLQSYGFDIDILLALHASVCSSRRDLSYWCLPGSSQRPSPSGLVDCLFRSRLLGVVGDVTKGVSVFSLRKNTCNRSCIALVRCNNTCTWMNVIEKTL